MNLAFFILKWFKTIYASSTYFFKSLKHYWGKATSGPNCYKNNAFA